MVKINAEVKKAMLLKNLDLILPQKCVLQNLISVRPKHETRIAYIAWLQFLGYTSAEATKLTNKVAAFWDNQTRSYNMKNIIQKQNSPYSCKKLKSKGLTCIRSCPMKGFK